MSYDRRKGFYSRERDIRDRAWDRPGQDYKSDRGGGRPMTMSRKRSRSPGRRDLDKRRSRSPRKNDKDMIDDNILSEIAKLPEPSELWDNNQYQDSGYPVPPPPPSFSRDPGPSYAPSYQPASYPGGSYDDFPPLASAPPHAPDAAPWNQMALPPPPAPTYHNPEDQLKKEAAIESEMRHQKAALSKQREDYIKKSTILKKELDTLKDQRNELRGDAKRSPSPDTKRFLKENTKLQLEIQNKLKTINNVVDMLNGIIGEEAQEVQDSDDSPERKRKSRSPSNKKSLTFNYVYYDPEMHWCRVCNDFPPTAKDYLNHLHSAAHHKSLSRMAAQHMEAPWHSVSGVNEGFPSIAAAPTKRTPIRGLQFFVPSTAWYCKLCDQFIGDLHCASAHLKSIVHSKNYTNFVEQNPHWETDWMSDRQKAFEKARAGNKLKPIEDKPHYTAHTITFSKDGFHTKRPKKSPSPPSEEKKKKKDKKKKSKRKRDSSSSSSSSDSSASETRKKKLKGKKAKNIDVNDDVALEAWMSNIQADRLSDADRRLLDSLKNRIKKDRNEKQIANSRDIERITEMQKKLRESERIDGRSRDERDERRESRDRRDENRDRRDDRRDERRDESRSQRWDRRDKELPEKKPEVKKMPFIGKMPVFKHLGKVKSDEQKKEEQKKKEEVESNAKKRLEVDAEIQKKVAEFKQKIAIAQQERGAAGAGLAAPGALAPPALALPSALGSALPPPVVLPPPPQPQPSVLPPSHTPRRDRPAAAPGPGQPALPKDFQEALDIIFPSDQKNNEKMQHGIFNSMQQPGILGVPPGMGMPNFPPMGLMHQPPNMFGFDMNSSLFPQPQLYDKHVPIMPPNQNKQRHKPIPHIGKKNQNNHLATPPPFKQEPGGAGSPALHHGLHSDNGDAAAKKKEELDDLAMLGIDASDVGAGI